MSFANNVSHIKATIKQAQESASASKELTLICVSKYHTVEEAQAIYDLGIRDFAENYVQGLLEKKAALPDDITWHLIGPLQSRKVKDVINQVDYFHALDRVKIAREIDKRADHEVKCFLEVNVSGEESKHGIKPEDVLDVVQAVADYPKVKIIGLMTMAPSTATNQEKAKLFRTLRSLQQEVASRHFSHAPCQELSMGMTSDYPIAVREGATFVRIGTAFFQAGDE
ncbi:MAG: YggS family pyridoxal phosphate-dependent enzyme [Aerococcus sp.]|nr:YggS family pyridoxal phosphate-dependent enzyme [Aerococcus sp.]